MQSHRQRSKQATKQASKQTNKRTNTQTNKQPGNCLLDEESYRSTKPPAIKQSIYRRINQQPNQFTRQTNKEPKTISQCTDHWTKQTPTPSIFSITPTNRSIRPSIHQPTGQPMSEPMHEFAFLGLAPEMAFRKPLEVHFEHFWALFPKWLSGSLGRFILSISGPRSRNGFQEAFGG